MTSSGGAPGNQFSTRVGLRFGGLVIARTVARVVAALLLAVALLNIARVLGPEAFGGFSLTLSVAYFLSALFGVGASTRILRIQAEHEGERLASALLLTRVGSALLAAGISLAVGHFSGGGGAVILGIAIAFSDSICEFSQGYLAAMGRQLTSALVVVSQRVVLVVVVLMTLEDAHALVISVAIALICFAAVVTIPPLCAWRRPFSVAFVVKTSVGYWFSSLASNISQLEAPMLKIASNAQAVGLYAIAGRIANPLTIVIGAMQTVFVPELSKRISTPAFRPLFSLFLAISAGYAAILILLSPVIASLAILFLGDDYEGARPLLIAMSVAAGLSAVSQAFQARLLAHGRPGISAWIVGIASLMGVALLGGVGAWSAEKIWIVPIIVQTTILIGLALAGRVEMPDQRGFNRGKLREDRDKNCQLPKA